jgi:hypothetical protein
MFWLGRLGADLLTGGTRGIAATNLVTVAPHATALVAVLPSAFGVINPIEPMPLTVPNFEVRGYVQIRLPALFTPPNFVRQNGGNDALNMITPDELLFFTAGPPAMRKRIAGPGMLASVVQGVPAEARSDLLQMLLGQLDADGSDLPGFNGSLAEAGVSLATERRAHAR